MSHFGSELFDELGNLWREFEIAGPFRFCNRTFAKTQAALGAMIAFIVSNKGLTSSAQFLRGPHESGPRKLLP